MDRRGILSAGGRAGGQRVRRLAPHESQNTESSHMDLIEPGKKAAAFSLNDQTGKTHRLADYAGKPVVLFFYPKDDTPGCTKEACDFRDANHLMQKRGIVVLGVSTDDVQSHQKFADKYQLPFPLLADTDTTVSQLYDVYKEKNLYGKK